LPQTERTSNLRILPLSDNEEAIPVLVSWFENVWPDHYGPGGPGDAAADLRECCTGDPLPFALLALDGSGAPVGTAALKREWLGSERHPGPWLAALLVAPAHRGAGVARALVAAIEDAARYLGYVSLYAAMEADSDLLTRRSWRPVDRIATDGGGATVYCLDLAV